MEQADAVPVITAQPFSIRPVTGGDFRAWGALRRALWPDEEDVDAEQALRTACNADAGLAALLATDAAGAAIGFVDLALRRDYVNGTATSPVAFLEGWYVVPAWRGRGVGRALVRASEQWARAMGCSEFASDALLDEHASHAAHLACGFEETERVVYFRKALDA
jgi:aminoglycoside 6'-N-acetyltransferase I